jgi:hypothetical protein
MDNIYTNDNHTHMNSTQKKILFFLIQASTNLADFCDQANLLYIFAASCATRRELMHTVTA